MRSGHLLRTAVVAAVCVSVAATVPAGAASPAAEPGPAPYRMVWDDFSGGFADSGPGARWAYAETAVHIPNDGIATTSRRGLRVVAGGTNQRTGDPAFRFTVPQGELGGLDHAKWVAFTTHVASSGVAGFDAVPGHELSCQTRISARTHGTANHPFGPGVDRNDLRLASVAMNMADFETGVVLDFFLTNDRIYAFYERGPFHRSALGDYAAFTHAVPVAKRAPRRAHALRIGYDAARGVVRWYVDGRAVHRVDRIGAPADRRHMILDHGGTPTDVRPRQFNCGMGMFSVLDAAKPGVPRSALVRLSDTDGFYFDPVSGPPAPQRFVDERSRPDSRLFGQGAEFHMDRYVVSSLPINRGAENSASPRYSKAREGGGASADCFTRTMAGRNSIGCGPAGWGVPVRDDHAGYHS